VNYDVSGRLSGQRTIDFKWSSNDADGASVSRATNGEVRVYKANGTAETTTGVTDTEDFDGLTGIHHCRIATTDAFYATGNDYMVVLAGATIDGQTVNAVLAHFSIRTATCAAPIPPTPAPRPPLAAIADQVVGRSAQRAHHRRQRRRSPGRCRSGRRPLDGRSPGSYYGGRPATSSATWSPGPGAGAIAFTYTLTSSVDGSPIVDADVWVTADAAGNTILASGRTDSNGEVTFYLDPGTVYVWRQKPGWNFDNPDVETID
jgi:hypothetical protein